MQGAMIIRTLAAVVLSSLLFGSAQRLLDSGNGTTWFDGDVEAQGAIRAYPAARRDRRDIRAGHEWRGGYWVRDHQRDSGTTDVGDRRAHPGGAPEHHFVRFRP